MCSRARCNDCICIYNCYHHNIIALTPKKTPVNVVYLIDRVLKIVFFRVRVHRVVVHHLPSFRHQVFANSYDDRNAVLAGHVRVVLLWHAGFAKRFIRLEFYAFVLTFFIFAFWKSKKWVCQFEGKRTRETCRYR